MKEYVMINKIRVPIEEFSERRLGELPNGGIGSSPVLRSYGEVVLGIYKKNIYDFEGEEYDSLLEFLAENSITDGEWIPKINKLQCE